MVEYCSTWTKGTGVIKEVSDARDYCIAHHVLSREGWILWCIAYNISFRRLQYKTKCILYSCSFQNYILWDGSTLDCRFSISYIRHIYDIKTPVLLKSAI